MTRRHIPRLLSRLPARGRDGATALEFALVLPLILAFTFGIIEVGHLMWTLGALNMAVEDAARCVSVSNVPTPPSTLCDTQAHMQTYAVGRTLGMTVPASTFTLTTPACGYLVSASLPYQPIVGYIPMAFTLTASACYPVWH
ncbi:MAG TPA: TadE/TadG family type IV pilus assembly protein [Stellaceae bacterium]